ncbi:DNA-formamidopyrimidine glycosylase family protein [Agilicoccus flavus]|uniref:DNA-formamidopyrimidine glycosylase family protein n=1 Tax=Agilicoccus flavus TaxID=2775968 RepID=UPI001CF6D936|nr:DNA-formamidopyrimidine glycosylase family protein [Agilicoccus flavus]
MPEGDTVFRTARRLHQALAGAELTVTDLRWAGVAEVDLTGRSTLEVVSRGKHVLHRVEGGVTIHSHLRMDGQWRVAATSDVSARDLGDHRLRAVVGTSVWTCLGRLLGMLDVVPTSEEHTLVGHLGPDLLGPDWDASEALHRVRAHPDVAVGEALLDQRNLAGIGTMYAAESLFLQRLHPWTPIAELPDGALEALVDRARRLLLLNRENAVQTTTGRGGREPTTWVHARSGRPCLRCGATVRVSMIGPAPRERTMFSCPACQGGPGPADDGRPQEPLGSAGGRGGEVRRRSRGAGRRSY